MKYLVTGGAGFIGSNIVDRLLAEGNEVIVYDDFSTGKELFIAHHADNKAFTLITGDVLDTGRLIGAMRDVDFVFHMSAHADVREGFIDHQIDHVQNLEGTRSVLEAMHKAGVKKMAFASTSSVYGDATIHPTPESYPFEPTSLYGASKASAESYIQVYASYYDWQVYIFRFASFIGERYTHGIIRDVLKKIKQNPTELALFSDGTPRKSSVYVDDGVAAMIKAIGSASDRVNIFNIGHDDVLTIDQIVDTILEAAQVQIEKKYAGGDKGWKGDNNYVHLDIAKLKGLGWKPQHGLKEGIKKTVAYLQENPHFLD